MTRLEETRRIYEEAKVARKKEFVKAVDKVCNHIMEQCDSV